MQVTYTHSLHNIEKRCKDPISLSFHFTTQLRIDFCDAGVFCGALLSFDIFCNSQCICMPYMYLKTEEKMLLYSVNNIIADKEEV